MQKLKEISHVKLLNRQNTDYNKVKISTPPTHSMAIIIANYLEIYLFLWQPDPRNIFLGSPNY